MQSRSNVTVTSERLEAERLLREVQRTGEFDRWVNEAEKLLMSSDWSELSKMLDDSFRQLESEPPKFSVGTTKSAAEKVVASSLRKIVEDSGSLELIGGRISELLFSDNEFSQRLNAQINALLRSSRANPATNEPQTER